MDHDQTGKHGNVEHVNIEFKKMEAQNCDIHTTTPTPNVHSEQSKHWEYYKAKLSCT